MKTLRLLLLPAGLAFSLAGSVTAAETKTTEASALDVLSSAADLHEKARACQELAYLGGPASVPALAALLGEEHLADYARSGLEGIKDPAAGAALRQALPRLSGRQLAGAVNSLGVRRELAAVSDLRQLALDPKRGVAAEAIASLGMIGTSDAAKVLREVLADGPVDLRTPAAHAALTAARQLAKDGHVSVARGLLDGVIRAFPDGPLVSVAKNQAAALGAKPASAARK